MRCPQRDVSCIVKRVTFMFGVRELQAQRYFQTVDASADAAKRDALEGI